MIFRLFPALAGESNAGLSVDNVQVQDALRVIETVLASEGFNRDTNTPVHKSQGFVANYAKNKGTGQRPIGGPSVYFRGNELDVVVVEGGNLNAPISTATKRICNTLRTELSKRYGTERVRVEWALEKKAGMRALLFGFAFIRRKADVVKPLRRCGSGHWGRRS